VRAYRQADLDDARSAAEHSAGEDEQLLDGEQLLARAQLELLEESCATARRKQDEEALAAMAKVVGGIVHGPKFTEKKSIFQGKREQPSNPTHRLHGEQPSTHHTAGAVAFLLVYCRMDKLTQHSGLRGAPIPCISRLLRSGQIALATPRYRVSNACVW
jgi:hypothetical protein